MITLDHVGAWVTRYFIHRRNIVPLTWSPIIQGSSSDPTVAYTTQSGEALRIFDRVELDILLTINTISSGNGDVRITLPFTATRTSFLFGLTNSVDWPSGSMLSGVVLAGNNYARLTAYGDNIGAGAVQISGLANGDSIALQGRMLI